MKNAVTDIEERREKAQQQEPKRLITEAKVTIKETKGLIANQKDVNRKERTMGSLRNLNAGSKQRAKENRLTLDKTDNEGFTALHRAAKTGNVEAMKSLIDEGAGLEAERDDDTYPDTPLSLAAVRFAETGDRAGFDLLLSRNVFIENHCFNMVAETGSIPVFEELLSRITEAYIKDLDEEKEDICTVALTHAVCGSVSNHKPEMVQYLLSKGADAKYDCPSGRTPLEWALFALSFWEANLKGLRKQLKNVQIEDSDNPGQPLRGKAKQKFIKEELEGSPFASAVKTYKEMIPLLERAAAERTTRPWED